MRWELIQILTDVVADTAKQRNSFLFGALRCAFRFHGHHSSTIAEIWKLSIVRRLLLIVR